MEARPQDWKREARQRTGSAKRVLSTGSAKRACSTGSAMQLSHIYKYLYSAYYIYIKTTNIRLCFPCLPQELRQPQFLATMPKLILVRHGQSEWNELNLFTGWVDVRLSAIGEKEAARAGQLMKEKNVQPDVLYTSKLSRAIQTANIALSEADRLWIPVKRSWRLNERHYGALQGKDKAATLEQYGEEQFNTWRRSFDVPPPDIEDSSEFSQKNDARYKDVDPSVVPKTESLALVIDRMLPYWQDVISKDLLEGKTVMIAAHGNSLRGLVKHLEGISDADIAGLNIPTGIPLVFELDQNLKPTKPSYYLDPEAAAAGAAKVASQGKK